MKPLVSRNYTASVHLYGDGGDKLQGGFFFFFSRLNSTWQPFSLAQIVCYHTLYVCVCVCLCVNVVCRPLSCMLFFSLSLSLWGSVVFTMKAVQFRLSVPGIPSVKLMITKIMCSRTVNHKNNTNETPITSEWILKKEVYQNVPVQYAALQKSLRFLLFLWVGGC